MVSKSYWNKANPNPNPNPNEIRSGSVWENYQAVPDKEMNPAGAQIEAPLNAIIVGDGTHRVELDARYPSVERNQFVCWSNNTAQVGLPRHPPVLHTSPPCTHRCTETCTYALAHIRPQVSLDATLRGAAVVSKEEMGRLRVRAVEMRAEILKLRQAGHTMPPLEDMIAAMRAEEAEDAAKTEERKRKRNRDALEAGPSGSSHTGSSISSSSEGRELRNAGKAVVKVLRY